MRRQLPPRSSETRIILVKKSLKIWQKCYKVKLILSKIIKIVANRRHILRLKCIKFVFGWGFAPDLAWGAQSAPYLPEELTALPQTSSCI